MRRFATHCVLLPLLSLTFPWAGVTAQNDPIETNHPSVALPPELDRVLRDYEQAWRARNAAGLAVLFTEDAFVMSPGRPAVRGRKRIELRYANSGGALVLRALEYAVSDSVGYIIGGYGRVEGEPDVGKFILALRRGSDGRWLIVADMDNGNS